MKKISPIRKPQNAPQAAPAPAVLCSWRVMGCFLPSGQLTTAASSRLIIWRSCSPCRARSTLSAPSRSLNFRTDRVAILATLSFLCFPGALGEYDACRESIKEEPFL
jgi:hypothetical protein